MRPSHRWTNAIARLFRYQQLQWESAAHPGWREALRFSGSSIYALSKKKSLLCGHVQTQSAHPFPSLFCLFPPPCKTGISKELWCQDRAPPWEVLWQVSTVCTSKQKVGVTQGTFLTTITQKTLKLCKHEELLTAHTHTKIHGEISTVLLPLCERYFLSLAYRQAWQQWAGLLSQLLKK